MNRKYAAACLLACDIGISPAAFYLSQAAGVGVVRALVIATVVASLWLGVGMLRTRRADALALMMMVTYAMMLAMAAATHDARLVLLRDPVISAVAGVVFLASVPTAFPATAYLASRLHGADRPDAAELHRHRVQTSVWGIALTAEALVRVALVFLLPVPITAGLSPTVELVLIAILVAWTVLYRKRHARSQPKQAPERLPIELPDGASRT